MILSHGSEGSGAFLASLLAPTMVDWGLVCIAPNYTHAAGVPIGAPGDASQPGASQANVDRALHVYAGESHLQVRTDPTMLARVRTWFSAHGMF